MSNILTMKIAKQLREIDSMMAINIDYLATQATIEPDHIVDICKNLTKMARHRRHLVKLALEYHKHR